MKILFFDTETTGFPSDGPLESQPHIVQIGAIFGEYKEDGSVISEKQIDWLINPCGTKIPAKTTDIHGITDDMVADKPLFKHYAKEFIELARQADFICGHNVQFDRKMIFIQIDRAYPQDNEAKEKWKKEFIAKELCTMNSTAKFVGIKRGFGFKSPKLSELHEKLFNKGFDNAHNAFNDILATKACFFELKKIGVLKF